MIFRMTSAFIQIFSIFIQGDAARLRNFAATQLSSPLLTKAKQRLKHNKL